PCTPLMKACPSVSRDATACTMVIPPAGPAPSGRRPLEWTSPAAPSPRGGSPPTTPGAGPRGPARPPRAPSTGATSGPPPRLARGGAPGGGASSFAVERARDRAGPLRRRSARPSGLACAVGAGRALPRLLLPARRRLQGHAGAPGLGQADGDGLLGR